MRLMRSEQLQVAILYVRMYIDTFTCIHTACNLLSQLRRERVVFENVYRKMERELQERKKKMAEIIEVSNQAYEQRDTFQMEIAAVEQVHKPMIIPSS